MNTSSTKSNKKGDEMVDKMSNPPGLPKVVPNDKGNDKDKVNEKDKDKDEKKSVLSEEMKKAISVEIGKKFKKSEKKQDEFTEQLERCREESKDAMSKLSQEVANIAKLFKSQDEEEYQNNRNKPSETGCSTWLKDDDDVEDSSQLEEHEEDIEQPEGSLMDGLQSYKISRRVKPSASVIEAWATTRKVTTEFQLEDWKKYSEDPVVKHYTMHPGASSFKAPEADPECPPLYQDGKEREKKYQMIQNMTGCCGHMVAELLVNLETEMQNMTDAIKDYMDPNVNIAEPRKEAADCFEAIRDNVLKPVGKISAALLKILGPQFNQITLLRREPFIKRFSDDKGCKQIIKKLKPSDSQLFGGKLTETAKNMHASDQLTILTGKKRFKPATVSGRGGYSYTRGKGSFRGVRGSKSARAFKGRAGKFGAKKEED